MPVDSQRVQAVFLRAVEAPPGERAALLNRECAHDAELRRRVEALLRAHDADSSFLSASPTGMETEGREPIQEGAGTVIGSYKLLEQIGEGGMGTVWMAQQTEPVKRAVAIKLIKAGMDSRHVLARFEAERQALALMDHPNIAKVHDAGITSDGRPYFVMELVKGVPITNYCDARRLTPRQRLELFASVCHAIQHAHQKGIIHRDIKPSNVLVALYDDRPVPKIIDFGVAKATGTQLTDKTLHTGFGAVVGTLEYMSPEQAGFNQLDIDTRSDVYSLGVLLYELLAGSPPFSRKEVEKAGMLEMLRVIREQEPSKPSTKLSTAEGLPTLAANRGTEPAKLTKLVKGELDWIVMKALEKDRSRRYETANGFAMDVQRYLVDEPVLACPPSVGYRLRKFVRRNKAALMMASVVTLAVLLVAGSIGWMVRNQAAQKEQADREVATRRRVVEQFLKESDRHLQANNWQQSLAAAHRAEAVLAGGPADEDLTERVAERLKDLQMVGDLEELAAAVWDPDRPAAENYATLFRRYGIDVDTLAADKAAARIRDRAIRNFLVGALDYWATERGGTWAGPLKAVKQKPVGRHLLAITRAADPHPFRNRIRDALAQEDEATLVKLADAARTAELAPAAATLLANALARVGGHRGKAVMILRQVQLRHPDDLELTSSLASYLWENPKSLPDGIRFYQAALALRSRSLALATNLANALENAGRKDEALIIRQRAAELHPQDPHAQYNLGFSLFNAGQLPEAVRAFQEAIRLQIDVASAHIYLGAAYVKQRQWGPAIDALKEGLRLDPKSADGLTILGAALQGTGRLDEALVACRKAVELKPDYAMGHTNLGAVLGKMGRTEEEIRCYRKAIDLDANLVEAHLNLGLALQRRGKFREAAACFRKVIELDPKTASAHAELGTALTRQGEVEEGIACMQRALDIDPKNIVALMNLGTARSEQGKAREAIACYRKVLEINPRHANALNGLAWQLATCADLQLRNPAEAVKLAEASTRLKPEDGGIWNTLGVARYRAGEYEAAVAALTKSMELSKGGTALDWFILAMAHQKLDKMEEARKWYDGAVQWTEKNQPQDEELRRFRREAEEVLGIKKDSK
jgi:serine/threonine protein kinase/tetratricopeptide (TPR) repeat protein